MTDEVRPTALTAERIDKDVVAAMVSASMGAQVKKELQQEMDRIARVAERALKLSRP